MSKSVQVPVTRIVNPGRDRQTLVDVSRYTIGIDGAEYQLDDDTRVALISALIKDLPEALRMQNFPNIIKPKKSSARRKSSSLREWGALYAGN